MNNIKKVAIGLLVVITAVTATGCLGSDKNDAAKAAESTEGQTITIYSGRNEKLIKPLIEKFTAETKIKAEVRYADSAALSAQLLEEGKNSPADVFLSQDAGALGALTKAGEFAELPKSELEKVPAAYRAKDGSWVGVSGRARVIAYNPAKVAAGDVPKSVFDLTDPKWKWRIGYAPTNASFQSFVTAMRVKEGEARTKTWLEGLKANAPKTFTNNGLALDAVNKGEVDLALVNHYYLYAKRAESNTPVSVENAFLSSGDPGALVNVAGVGILKTSKKTAASQRFVEYLLSEDAQKYFRDQTFEYPLIEGVSPSEGLPSLSSVSGDQVDLTNLDSLAETQNVLRSVGMI